MHSLEDTGKNSVEPPRLNLFLIVPFPDRCLLVPYHDGMQVRVQNDGEFSEPFEVTNGVKQGCVMAPTLFRMMFSGMIMDAFQDSDTGFSNQVPV